MRKQYYCIILLISLGILSCKRNSTTSPSVFTEASYPLSIGNWWQYELTSLTFNPDTFTLRVDSVVADGPYRKYICNYVGNGAIIPAGYFLESDTSMSFVQPYGYFTSFPSFHLKFPVQKGQYWQGAFSGDSILVVGVADSCQGSYGNTYGACYSTVESYNLPHNFKVEDMLLTPKIGLVSQNIDLNSDTAGIQIQQRISLISYHVQ